MPKTKQGPTILPALRGLMGNWIYYSCLMQFSELSSRISFADDVHKHTGLSSMIQRALTRSRKGAIAEYIKTQPQHFFNSLVIAVYGGEPNWHPIGTLHNLSEDSPLEQIQPETLESVGFLTLRGDEHLFALDGQHRLAGIKAVIGEGFEPAFEDEVSVILVAHEKTDSGLERTRRLFTTLNKTARPVTKGDIIALDEDDVMAITVRRLIEQTELFNGDRIAFVQSNNIPPTNTTCLTTIGNLYDLVTMLFTEFRSPLRLPKASLQRVRPSDEVLDQYFHFAMEFFGHLRANFFEMEEFFSAVETTAVVHQHRGRQGGSALFRPLGLGIFSSIIARFTKTLPLVESVKQAAKLPRVLAEPPYKGLMWDESSMTIVSRNRVTLREILSYMLGVNRHEYSAQTLLERYRKETGDESATLPNRFI